MDTRGLGLLVIALGGGRRCAGDEIDPRVGMAALAKLGQWVEPGAVLAVVHAATEADADMARHQLLACMQIGPQPPVPQAVMLERLPG
jgi:thymidine phosphorylase